MISKKTFVALCLLGVKFTEGVKLGQYFCAPDCYDPCCQPMTTCITTPHDCGCGYTTTCSTDQSCQPSYCPTPRVYVNKQIRNVHQPPVTTYLKAPSVHVAPPNVVVHINKDTCRKPCCDPCCDPCKDCCKPEECFDKIELSDDEDLPLPPVDIITPPGVVQEEFDLLRDEFFALRADLTTMLTQMEENQNIVEDNMQTIVSNMGALEQTLNNHDNRIDRNTDEIKALKEALAKLESEMMQLLSKVGADVRRAGQVNWSDALMTLENQIKQAGGLNIGDRWRLRFKDDSNKDLFLQDRSKKGYYRFRTTNCDHIVKGVKCNDCCQD